jgi:hypothetical protein
MGGAPWIQTLFNPNEPISENRAAAAAAVGSRDLSSDGDSGEGARIRGGSTRIGAES